MLRMLFGERPREWEGQSLDTVKAIREFIRLNSELAKRRGEKEQFRYQKHGIWAEGLLRSMDELEQSRYAAKRYAAMITHTRLDEFTPEERLNYDRHVYFDKNAYIRIFALMDKLGTLLNDLLRLETEKIKSQFSYFTVLRNMRTHGKHPELSKPLDELKELHQEALARVRSRRNIEIHQMNAELQDDLRQALDPSGERRKVEDIASNMADLDRCWDLAERSLGRAFRFACAWLKRTG